VRVRYKEFVIRVDHINTHLQDSIRRFNGDGRYGGNGTTLHINRTTLYRTEPLSTEPLSTSTEKRQLQSYLKR
jgi:hypothetical protein